MTAEPSRSRRRRPGSHDPTATPTEPHLTLPEPLTAEHDTADFDCGAPALNEYLAARALGDQRAEKSRTYVARRAGSVVAYFSLAAGVVQPAAATRRLAQGQGRQLIPVILLARLAVDRAEQGRGLGETMLLEALTRAVAAADVIGARAVLVHAMDERARAFYQKYGFQTSPTDPLHLVLLLKDIRRTLGL